MNVPLLLERAKNGKGPKVPIRSPFKYLVVEGLSEPDVVALFVNDRYMDGFTKDGKYELDEVLPRGVIAQMEVIGCGSCVSVHLEGL